MSLALKYGALMPVLCIRQERLCYQDDLLLIGIMNTRNTIYFCVSKQREQHDVRDVKTARHYLFLFSSHLWLVEIELFKFGELNTINLWAS